MSRHSPNETEEINSKGFQVLVETWIEPTDLVQCDRCADAEEGTGF